MVSHRPDEDREQSISGNRTQAAVPVVDRPEESTTTSPRVTVVVPTCNRPAAIRRCVEALLDQTYANFEVIVVDDASDDDTSDVLAALQAGAPTIVRFLRNDERRGANPSRNRGVAAGDGELVAFLDDDCTPEPEWIERLVDGFANDRVAAVTGLVLDRPPTNIYELTFKGTHRVHGAIHASRLVAGNMCVRRTHLAAGHLDEDRATRPDGDMTVSGRGDEEGLALRLRAAGYELRVTRDAVVHHDHGYTRRSFFRQAFRGGRSAAKLVYKFHLRPRLDLLPFMLAYGTLALGLIDARLLAIPLLFLGAALAAITYNDLARKGKTLVETARSFPLLVAYYHVRLVGYTLEASRLRLGLAKIERERLG